MIKPNSFSKYFLGEVPPQEFYGQKQPSRPSQLLLTEILVDCGFTFWNAWAKHKDTIPAHHPQPPLKESHASISCIDYSKTASSAGSSWLHAFAWRDSRVSEGSVGCVGM
jgi:hypothetical protein